MGHMFYVEKPKPGGLLRFIVRLGFKINVDRTSFPYNTSLRTSMYQFSPEMMLISRISHMNGVLKYPHLQIKERVSRGISADMYARVIHPS
jgi:hypothetical protein